MGIISALQTAGIPVVKTGHFFRGLREAGGLRAVSRDEKECFTGIYFLGTDAGKVFPCDDTVMYITKGTDYEGKRLDIAEAEALARDGRIFCFKSSDLYAEWYGFDEDEDLRCCFQYGYTARSRKYIEEVMGQIGLTGYTDGAAIHGCPGRRPAEFEATDVYSVVPSADTRIGKAEGQYIALTSYPSGDDTVDLAMYFCRHPSQGDVYTAFIIRKFETKPAEVFWDHGNKKWVHWLETDGGIYEKYQKVTDNYSGC